MNTEAILQEIMKRSSLLKQRKNAGDITSAQLQTAIEELSYLAEFIQKETILQSRTSR